MSELPPDDAVEQAAAAVRATPVPALPEGLVQAAATRVAAEVRRTRRRKIMRYATIGTAAACLALTAGLLLTGDTAQASLLRAFEKQEKAKSYKVVTSTLKPDGTVDPTSVQTTYVSGDKSRSEHPGGIYWIHDPAGKTDTVIDPKAKRVTTGTLPAGEPGRDHHTTLMEEAKKAIKAGKGIEKLADETIDGRKMKVYRATAEVAGLQAVSTYWLDAKDETLVRYEADCVSRRFRVTKGEDGKSTSEPVPGPVEVSTVVVEFSDFGKTFDPKLFDTTPPAGYKVTAEEFYAIPSQPAEQPKK